MVGLGCVSRLGQSKRSTPSTSLRAGSERRAAARSRRGGRSGHERTDRSTTKSFDWSLCVKRIDWKSDYAMLWSNMVQMHNHSKHKTCWECFTPHALDVFLPDLRGDMREARSGHIYGKNATVHLVTDVNKFATMERAMAESGFYDNVEAAWEAAGVPRDEFRIVIKPNIMTAAARQRTRRSTPTLRWSSSSSADCATGASAALRWSRRATSTTTPTRVGACRPWPR